MNLLLAVIGMILIYLFLKSRKSDSRSRRVYATRPVHSREWVKELHEWASGNRCDVCGEQYVGMARDCRCTNYGK